MRSEFREESYEHGREAEERFHEYLHKKGIDHIWFNEEKESGKRGDFIANQRRIEVEHKQFEKYRGLIEAEGMDLLEDKVRKHSDETLYVIETGVGFYYIPMWRIKERGKVIEKMTKRGVKEKFYRVKISSMEYVSYN